MTSSSSMSIALLLLVLLVAGGGLARADDQRFATDRPGARALALPDEDDAFSFVVFGDRTGGPRDGIEVLEQAVADPNLPDPAGRPQSLFDGAIDDVRVSAAVRYTGERVDVARPVVAGEATRLLLSMDHARGPWVLDASARRVHARTLCGARLAAPPPSGE